ncbi:hypothetical protein BN1723_013062 [Verticillium longisporum]|uniref:Uncharacterized protein n=1 Tax=Verticillium longisporum TaxID=100787 RepID=A0A0G4LNM8_VERLO|nr:hypothetical protein BN1723_013062 [Verticillium longisporum]
MTAKERKASICSSTVLAARARADVRISTAGLELDGQAVAVPARAVFDAAALLDLDAQDHVLEDLVEAVADVEAAIGGDKGDKGADDVARGGPGVQGRLIAETNAAPVDVEAFLGRQRQQQQQQQQQGTVVIREESDDEDAVAALAEVPTRQDDAAPPARPAKRRRALSHTGVPGDDEFASTSDDEPGGERADEKADDEINDDGLFVDDHADDSEASPPSKRRRKQDERLPEGAEKAVGGARGGHDHQDDDDDDDDGDDKKKMAMDVSFDGFAIHGRVLCLVVKRRDTHRAPAASGRSAASAAPGAAAPAGQAVMENWISSTQMPNPGADVEAVDE